MHKRHWRSSSDLFTDLHCAGEDDAAFFRHAMRWRQYPITMWRSNTNTHTHTHTHTHTYTLFPSCCFFFLCFLFFSFCLLVSLVSLAIHLVFSSCGTQAQTHHGTNKQTHTAITFASASLHLDLCPGHWCAIISAPRWTFMVVLSYTISWSSVHSYSVFLWALCSLSLSQVSHSVKLTRQGNTGCYNTATYKLTYLFASSNL